MEICPHGPSVGFFLASDATANIDRQACQVGGDEGTGQQYKEKRKAALLPGKVGANNKDRTVGGLFLSFFVSVSVNIYNTGDAPATQRTVRDFSGTFFATGCMERREEKGSQKPRNGFGGWERRKHLLKWPGIAERQ